MHGWGSNFMVAVVLIHMAQVFLFGAYKFPRELTWILGVFMLLMTLGMAFTGQVLRFDQDAYWGLGIGASIWARVPFIGRPARPPHAGRPDHQRRHAVTRFSRCTCSSSPARCSPLRPACVAGAEARASTSGPCPAASCAAKPTSRSTTTSRITTAFRSCPAPCGRTWSSPRRILLAVACCAVVFGPYGPKGVPDPTIIETVPKPDFFFLWIYTVLSYLPPEMETPFILIAPVVGIAVLIALPFVAGVGEKSWWRRPVAVFSLMFIAVCWASFTRLATYTPWSPKMTAWSGAVIPVAYLEHRTPLERQGAQVFQDKQCRNCHSLGGIGGQRGPALDDVANRLTEDQLYRQVLLGGGNMPAYGSTLSPAETTALVHFLTRFTRTTSPQRPTHRASLQARMTFRPTLLWSEATARRTTLRSRSGLTTTLALLDADADVLSRGILRAWSLPLVPFTAIVLTTAIYLRGFVAARQTRAKELPVWRGVCFLAGTGALWIALASPIDALDDFLLSAHMIQHFILMSVAPPLVMLGAPRGSAAAGSSTLADPAAVTADICLENSSRDGTRARPPCHHLAGYEHLVPGVARTCCF